MSTSTQSPITELSSLVGTMLGTVERQFGLMRSTKRVSIERVIDCSGDLAVADRIAFVQAYRSGSSLAVVEYDRWYVIVDLGEQLGADQLQQLVGQGGSGIPRLLSVATARGITPLIDPLVRAAS